MTEKIRKLNPKKIEKHIALIVLLYIIVFVIIVTNVNAVEAFRDYYGHLSLAENKDRFELTFTEFIPSYILTNELFGVSAHERVLNFNLITRFLLILMILYSIIKFPKNIFYILIIALLYFQPFYYSMLRSSVAYIATMLVAMYSYERNGKNFKILFVLILAIGYHTTALILIVSLLLGNTFKKSISNNTIFLVLAGLVLLLYLNFQDLDALRMALEFGMRYDAYLEGDGSTALKSLFLYFLLMYFTAILTYFNKYDTRCINAYQVPIFIAYCIALPINQTAAFRLGIFLVITTTFTLFKAIDPKYRLVWGGAGIIGFAFPFFVMASYNQIPAFQ